MLTSAALIAAHLAGAQPVIANPASTHCISVGGRLEFVTTRKGQIGICILPDGRRIEEWKLYRRAMNRPKGNVRF